MKNTKINAVVGILTYNNEKTLKRCLESVKNFQEIIISDGGSTDKTLKIAKSYNCRIIKQKSKGTIVDFAKERNHLLKHTTNNWFFYLDSDETISPFLKEEITKVTNEKHPKHFVYQITFKVIYKGKLIEHYSSYPTWQNRLFHKIIKSKFIKNVHERIIWDKNKYPTGKLSGNIYLYWDDEYVQKFWKRANRDIALEIEKAKNHSWIEYFRWTVFHTMLIIITRITKNAIYHLLHPFSKRKMPVKIELLKIGYHLNKLFKISLSRIK